MAVIIEIFRAITVSMLLALPFFTRCLSLFLATSVLPIFNEAKQV